MDTLSPIPAAPAAAAGPTAPAQRPHAAAAKAFEAMMVRQMMESMFAGVSTDGMFGGGFAEETFRGLMLDAVATGAVEGQSLGIAAHVESQMAAYAQSKGE